MKKLPGANGVADGDLQKSMPKGETGGQLRGALSCWTAAWEGKEKRCKLIDWW